MKRFFNLLLIASFALITSSVMAKDTKLIGPTKTTFGWAVYSDKETDTKLETVKALKGEEALQLNYEFDECEWIAIVREVTFGLNIMEGIKFKFKGTGSVLNLQVKVADANGNVFGYRMLTGTKAPDWETVVIPRKDFEYFYGGDGKINWNALTKFEVTMDKGEPAGKYQLSTKMPGKLAIANVKIVPASKLIAPGSLRVGDKQKDGTYLIDPMATKGWAGYADQDGECELKDVKVFSKSKKSKRTISALKANYSFGKDGAWIAIVKETRLDLSKMKLGMFYYKGTGGDHKLVFKLVDDKERVFGYTLNSSTNVKNWKKVAIPVNQMKYLYGGPGESKANLSKIKKIEFTLEKKDTTTPTGVLYLRWLKYTI